MLRTFKTYYFVYCITNQTTINMQANTVVLSLSDYNDLMQSKKDLNELYKGEIDIVYYTYNQTFSRTPKRESFTKDEGMRDLIEKNNFLTKELNDTLYELEKIRRGKIFDNDSQIEYPQTKKGFWGSFFE